jgi:hypothetical protein
MLKCFASPDDRLSATRFGYFPCRNGADPLPDGSGSFHSSVQSLIATSPRVVQAVGRRIQFRFQFPKCNPDGIGRKPRCVWDAKSLIGSLIGFQILAGRKVPTVLGKRDSNAMNRDIEQLASGADRAFWASFLCFIRFLEMLVL